MQHNFPPDIVRKETTQYYLDISSISISHLRANKQKYGDSLQDLRSGAALLTSSVFIGTRRAKMDFIEHVCMYVCMCVFVCLVSKIQTNRPSAKWNYVILMSKLENSSS